MSVANRTANTRGRNNPAWCLPTTLSIRNFEEYGSTNPASLLITINTNPTASRLRRGRINFHTSGQTAFRRLISNDFVGALGGELNLLFDSFRPKFASLFTALSHILRPCAAL